MYWCQTRAQGAGSRGGEDGQMNTIDGHGGPEAVVSEEERVNRLVVHLAAVVQQGGEVLERWKYTAIVLRRTRASITPNLLMIVAGLALFGLTMEPLFALAAIVAALGWHRKILDAASPRRLLVRIEEDGRVREIEQPG
jgi:hypothetical protein